MILHAFTSGFSQVGRSKRLIIFAWILNVALSFVVVVPLLNTLDGYIGDTVNEEELLQQISANWFATFQADHRAGDIAANIDLTIFGHAVFYHHTELFLGGAIVKRIGHFFSDLVFRFRVSTEHIDLLLMLTLLYDLLWIFLAGGFISLFARNQAGSISEFLSEGARYVGPFLRLSLLAVLIFFLLFIIVVDPITRLISSWTEREASELTPFVYYMIRNIWVALMLAFLSMSTDYAKIRIVVDDRSSALVAYGAGMWFALRHLSHTGGLYILLTLIGFILISLYAIAESQIPQSGYTTILLMFIIQQIYVVMRLCLKTGFFATQTNLYNAISRQEHASLARSG
ncbi:MAG: hypothetical protein FJ215_12665 [Ignavibacteria bacterium]|nr:hypothetical protein [Ignavibacteria bacterium]